MFKIWACLATTSLVLGVSCSSVWSQDFNASAGPDQAGGETLAASIPREALEKLANLTQDDEASNMWILVPSNLSETQLHESNFALFKLNTGQLFNLGGEGHQQMQAMDWSQQGAAGQQQALPRLATAALTREARKMGLFSNVLNKPKVSPLYLVNGTVCRFVNSQPICTTLSTTGLFRNPSQGFLMQQQPNLNPNANPNSGFFSNGIFNGQQQQQQQQQQPNSRQVAPPQNGFQQSPPGFQLNQPGFQQNQPGFQQNQPGGFQQNQPGGFQQNIVPNQQFRPAAVMDDETQAVSLTNSSGLVRQKGNTVQTAASRPQPSSYTLVNRRPLNLLSLTRPFRTG